MEFNTSTNEKEEHISKLEDKAMENTQTEQQNNNKKRIKGSEDTLKDLWEWQSRIT